MPSSGAVGAGRWWPARRSPGPGPPPSAVRLAFWLRAVPMMHVAPLCGIKCRGWGLHLLWLCPLAAGAALRGFRAVALGLLRAGWRLRWASTTCFDARLGSAADSTWRLCCDADLTAACIDAFHIKGELLSCLRFHSLIKSKSSQPFL